MYGIFKFAYQEDERNIFANYNYPRSDIIASKLVNPGQPNVLKNVLNIIPTITTYSKAYDYATLKHCNLKQLIGSTGIIFGEHIISRRISFTHSF
mgnify:CR=1 FL=1